MPGISKLIVNSLVTRLVYYRSQHSIKKLITKCVNSGWFQFLIKQQQDSFGVLLFIMGKHLSQLLINLLTHTTPTKPTRVWGFEVEHQANLRFLPGLLSNIILSLQFLIRENRKLILQHRNMLFTIQPYLDGHFPVKQNRYKII